MQTSKPGRQRCFFFRELNRHFATKSVTTRQGQTFEQLNVAPASLGSAADYLRETDSAVLQMYGDEIVGVELPAAVELVVTETEPGVQGDRVSGARKPATVETGKVVQVPLFVNIGDKLRIDTRSGDYITRA